MADADRVFEEAEKFLRYLEVAAEDASITLPGADPYITVGEAVHDCEQTVATVVQAEGGLPDNQMAWGNCAMPWTAQFEVDIVRCEPKSNQAGLVAKSKLHEHARVQSGDASILMEASRRRADERFGNVTGQVSFLAPSGGMTVTRLTVSIGVF